MDKTQLIHAVKLTWQSKYLRNVAKAVAVIFPTLWILAILINWKLSGDRESTSAHAANLRKIAATETCRTLSVTDLAKLFQPTGSSFTSALDECISYESLEPYSGSKSLQERLQEIEENEVFVRLEWLSKELEAQKQLEIEREANVRQFQRALIHSRTKFSTTWAQQLDALAREYGVSKDKKVFEQMLAVCRRMEVWKSKGD